MNFFSNSQDIQNTLFPPGGFSVAFSMGDFDVVWYSIFFMIGFFVSICGACAVCHYRYKIKYDLVFWFALIIIPVGIFGARFWSAIIGDLSWNYFFNIFMPTGGLAIQGAVVFSGIAALIYFPLMLKKPKYHIQVIENKKTYIRQPSMWIFADIILPMILFGQAIGRWGNFFNGEIFGAETSYESISWLGAIADKMQLVQGVDKYGVLKPLAEGLVAGAYYQPLFFYEFLINLFSWTILYWVLPYIKNIKIGVAGSGYFVLYGITRFIMEPLRFNSYTFSATYWINGLLLTLGIILVVIAQFYGPKYRNKNMLYWIWIRYIRFYLIKFGIKLKIKKALQFELIDPDLKKYGFNKLPEFERKNSDYFYYGER
ncbi:MAG: prolipoprotein diacylglyceryl transferase [Mycoplasma sp.]